MESTTIVSHQTCIAELEEEAGRLKKERTDLNKRISAIENQCNEHRRKIELIKKGNRPLHVTDHAIVRYLERTGRIDVDQVRKEVFPGDDERMDEAIKTLGGGTFPIGNSHRIVVADRKIVTVKPVD